MKVGLIGLGAVGRLHLEAYETSSRIKVIAVADPAAERVAELQSGSGIAVYTNHRELLAHEDIEVVCVATPASTHEAVVLDAAAARRHVLCEKPLAVTSDASRRMITACASAGVKLAYGSSYRFLPAIEEARRIISDGALGRIYLLREHVIGGGGEERRQELPPIHYPTGGPGGSGMGLVDHGIHMLDIFGWLMGATAISARGTGCVAGAAPVTEFAVIRFDNGAVGHLIYEDRTFGTELPFEGHFSSGAGWDAEGSVPAGGWSTSPGTIYVYGSKGSLRILYYANAIYLKTSAGVRQLPVSGEPSPAHFRRQMESFVDLIEQGKSTIAVGEEGLAALQLMESIYQSNYDPGTILDPTQ